MSSDTAGKNPIVIPVVIDTTAAQQGLVRLKTAATTESKQIADTITQNMGAAERAAVKVPQEAAKATAQWGQSLVGVKPAITATSQALNLMGVQGTGAIATLTNSLAGLVATGFNPLLALAVGGGALLTGLLGDKPEYTERIEQAKADLDALREKAIALERQRLAARGGPSLSAQAADLDVDKAMGELVQAQTDKAKARRVLGPSFDYRPIPKDTLFLSSDFSKYWEAVERVNNAEKALAYARSIRAKEAERETIARRAPGTPPEADFNFPAMGNVLDRHAYDLSTEDDAAQFARDQAAQQARDNAAFERMMAAQAEEDARAAQLRMGEDPGSAPGRGQLRSEVALNDAIAARKDLEIQLRAIEQGSSTERIQALDRIAQAERELAEAKDLTPEDRANREKELDYLRQQVALMDRITAAKAGTGPSARPIVAADDPIARQFESSARSGVTSGLSDALMDPSNTRGALQSFATALQRATTDALAASLTEGLLGKQGSSGGGLLGSLGSIFGGSKTPAGTDAGAGADASAVEAGTGTVATKRASSQPIVVIPVYDEKNANDMVAKVSGTGARAFVARAQGGGVAAGVIPSGGR